MGNVDLSTAQMKKSQRMQRVLFVLVAVGMFLWLFSQGDMISHSGDATDIWQTITSYYSEDRYYSYVLYKGFASVYPYVWFYQLAVWLGINDFFFVMIYHAILFAYLTVVGIPTLISELIGSKPKLWQKVVVTVVLFWIWQPTRALSQIMVDLPSCGYFILAANGAFRLKSKCGWAKLSTALYTGLLCGLVGSISGQYSLAAVCIVIYALAQCISPKTIKRATKKTVTVLAAFLLLGGSLCAGAANSYFDARVIEPYRIQGNYMADGSVWMKRGLVYMLDKNRIFSGPQLSDPRGMAILEKHYGQGLARQVMDQATQGGYGWTIGDYLSIVLHYPQEFLPRFVDRLFLCVSTDLARNSLAGLLVGYTALYLALYTAVKKIKQMKQFFKAELWIVLGVLASVIPAMVLTVEMRYAMSLQGLIFGVAILGPALPWLFAGIVGGIREIHNKKSIAVFAEKQFPWGIVIGVVFVLCCVTHMAALYAQSGLGMGMLFSLF